MKAFVLRAYGSADLLELTTLEDPEPAPDEVLVRVRATSVNPYDWHGMRGEPYIARLMPGLLGLRRPKVSVLGCDVAGRVEAVGAQVTRFSPGDDVFALVEQGCFAEYVRVPERLLAAKPANVTYEQAAAMPMAGVTALIAAREAGRIRPGQRVLVNGASGGVGMFAVQIARALGATVTGVCGPGNVDFVRELGAHEVVDYSAQDFTRADERYDVLLDIAGRHNARACRRVLTPAGTLVLIGGPAGRWLQPAGHILASLATGPLVSQRVVLAETVGCTKTARLLTDLAELVEEHQVTPVIDREYTFGQLPRAVAYQEQGHARGKVVVTL